MTPNLEHIWLLFHADCTAFWAQWGVYYVLVLFFKNFWTIQNYIFIQSMLPIMIKNKQNTFLRSLLIFSLILKIYLYLQKLKLLLSWLAKALMRSTFFFKFSYSTLFMLLPLWSHIYCIIKTPSLSCVHKHLLSFDWGRRPCQSKYLDTVSVCLCVPVILWFLQFLVRVFTFFSLNLC